MPLCFFFFIFNWRVIALNMCWLLPQTNMKQPQEHVFPLLLEPSSYPSPPLQAVAEHGFELPAPHSEFPLLSVLQRSCVCFHDTVSVFPPSPSHAVSTSLFSTLPCKQVHRYHLDTTTMENSKTVPKKVGIELPSDPAVSLLGYTTHHAFVF